MFSIGLCERIVVSLRIGNKAVNHFVGSRCSENYGNIEYWGKTVVAFGEKYVKRAGEKGISVPAGIPYFEP